MITEKMAIRGLSALAHHHRLAAFRALVAAAPDGLSAGDIADRLGIPASTLSAHLAKLHRAGLVRSRRQRTRVYYAVDVEGTGALLDFLMRDCCGGQPALCGFGAMATAGRGHERHDPTLLETLSTGRGT